MSVNKVELYLSLVTKVWNCDSQVNQKPRIWEKIRLSVLVKQGAVISVGIF